MNKTKKAMGYYLTIAAAVLAIVGALLYGSVMYKLTLVYGFLAAAIVLGVVAAVFAGKHKLVNIIPIINGALMASAAVWSASLMVNQIGYVVSGLDGVETIQSFIIFCVICVIGMILNIVASFLPMAAAAEETK
jgi:hypothetical protein